MDIIDLSMPIAPHFRWSPELKIKGDIAAGDQFRVSHLATTCHGFSHVDAQAHFVANEKAAGETVAAARKAFGPIDVLVNLAGIRAYEPLAEAKRETWERILAANLLSYAWFIKAAIADLRAQHGSIVNISSTHAVNARAGMGQYDVTKAGIVSMTKTLAFEEARHGVRVNAVCPGATLTPFHLRRAAAAGRTQRELEQDAKEECLLGRWADPREVAFPILWLASDEASYVTGSVLMVDGGRYVK